MRIQADRHLRSHRSLPREAAYVFAALMPLVGSVRAQEQQRPLEEVLVTGSRIQTSIDSKANPLTVIGTEALDQTPGVALETLFRKQPQIDNNRGGVTPVQNNNGANSASTISLRNLGANRTLVLLDGRRTMSNFAGSSVDIDTIPISTIERIEILRSGASSVYGADAVGGVVNIITKKDYQGLEFALTAGSAAHDSRSYNASITGGGNFDRGNFLVTGGYSDRDIARVTNRSWAVDQFEGTPLFGQGPNASSIPGFVAQTQSPVFATSQFPNGGRPYFYGPANQFVLWRAGTPPAIQDGLAQAGIAPPPGIFFLPRSGYRYDFTPEVDVLITGFQQKNLGLNFRYDLADDVRFVTNTTYVDKKVPSATIPFQAGFFLSTPKYPGLYIPAFLEDYTWDQTNNILVRRRILDTNGNPIPNPGNPYGITIQGRTRFDGRPRTRLNTQWVLRTQAGFEGKLFDKFDWDAGVLFTRAESAARQDNTPNFSRLAQVTGQRPCGIDVATGCSIGNFFGVGTLTEEQYDYFLETQTSTGTQTQNYGYASLSGSVLPFPAGDLQFAAGVETRKEALTNLFDELRKSGEGITQADDTHGEYSVDSFFTEFSIPLLKDLPLARALTLTASGRLDDYSNDFGAAKTWKVGFDNDMGGGLTLRASYGTGFRAPNINELFSGTNHDSQDATDPCDVDNGALAGSSRCLADLAALGVDGTEYRSATPETALTELGGNRALRPEESRQWTVGLFYVPEALPSFNAQIDYYDVRIKDAINSFTAQSVMDACYGPLELACERITRSPFGGTVMNIDVIPLNSGNENVRGVDFSFAYGTDFGAPGIGRWDASVGGTYLLEHNVVGPDTLTVNNAGRFNFSETGAEPRLRGTIELGWSLSDMRAQWTTRYFGKVTNVDGTPAVFGNFADAYWLHDLALSWSPGQYSFILGVSNVLDEPPPVFTTGLSGYNSLPTAGYDYVGRFVFGRVKVAF